MKSVMPRLSIKNRITYTSAVRQAIRRQRNARPVHLIGWDLYGSSVICQLVGNFVIVKVADNLASVILIHAGI